MKKYLADLRDFSLAEALEAEADRYFLWIPVALGVGIGIYFLLLDEPSKFLAILSLCLFLALTIFFINKRFSALFLTCFLISLGFATAQWRAERVSAPILEKPLFGVLVEGTILEVDLADAGSSPRIYIKPETIGNLAPSSLPAKIRINMRRAHLPLDSSLDSPLQAGSDIALKAVLFPPSGPSEPGAYNPARRAYFQRIGAYGASSAKPLRLEESRETSWAAWIDKGRNRIARHVMEVIGGEEGALASALMTGKRGFLLEKTTHTLRSSGLAHILAISGLHMACFAGALFFFARAGLALFPKLALFYPIKKWAIFPAFFGATFYLFFSGSSVATERAFIMFLVIGLAVLIGRSVLTMRNVAIAAFLILILTPESLLTPGFQMSFAATMAIIALYETLWARNLFQFVKRDHFISSSLSNFFIRALMLLLTSVVAWAATGWFAAYHFQRVAFFTAFAANVLALPIFTIISMPSAVLAFLLMPLGWESLALSTMGWSLGVILFLAETMNAWLGEAVPIGVMPVATLPLVLLGGFWLCIWGGRWRYAGVFPIGAALLLAVFSGGDRPDLLVSRDGKNFALRAPDGKLYAPRRSGSYDLKAWIRRDGDLPSRDDIVSKKWFHCSRSACESRVPKVPHIVLLKEWRGAEKHCASAEILISRYFIEKLDCPRANLRIGRERLKKHGAHAIWFRDQFLEVAHAPPSRRPWDKRAGR